MSDAEKAAEEYARSIQVDKNYPFELSGVAYFDQHGKRITFSSIFLAGAAWAAPKCDETLIERLKKSRKIICALCKEGRPPHMSVPVQESDEDVFICDSIDMAIRALSRELQEKAKRERVK